MVAAARLGAGVRGSVRNVHKLGKFKPVAEGIPSSQLFASSLNTEKKQDAWSPASLGHKAAHEAFVALGSNLGDRVDMIEQACQKMVSAGIKIKATSFLYETAPMYVTEQATFLNAVCRVETQLSPYGLLDALQNIESELGRQRILNKGPRSIDLDIILYDSLSIEDGRLNIPHKLMLEREFVLRPLADLIPHGQLPPPHRDGTVADHLTALEKNEGPGKSLTITQLASTLPAIKANDPHRPTSIMAILNTTPDSFSTDGLDRFMDRDALRTAAEGLISSGVSIVDIGGQSTRPGADRISSAEELARILPAITAVRASAHSSKVAISVDTFYSDVARAAVEAGADIVNDVSAGTLDAHMLRTVARLGKTIILMHMRGDPSNMTKLTSYPHGVIEDVGRELRERAEAALTAGLSRWRIILDPGIGFAKSQAQNLEILRRLDDLRRFPGLEGFPWLVGTSRKGFIGKITGVKEASQRFWGTAAAVTASVQGGADIVRVHDVEAMRQVVQMADAIYRTRSIEITT